MKILVFSDTHLTHQFDQKKFLFLKRIISDADQVIINGDFWDGYKITFDDFISSSWNKLFSLLKSKKSIYIFGNHDQMRFCSRQMSLFSVKQVDRYFLKTKKYNFVIEHGNKIFPFYDENTDIKMPISIKLIYDLLEKTLIKISGNLFFIFPLGKQLNITMKNRFKKKYFKNEILICGHTHSPEFNIKNNLINVGFIRHGLAHFLIIDGEKIEFKEEWYA